MFGALAGMGFIAELLRLLPERDPHAGLYDMALAIAENLHTPLLRSKGHEFDMVFPQGEHAATMRERHMSALRRRIGLQFGNNAVNSHLVREGVVAEGCNGVDASDLEAPARFFFFFF